MTEPAYCNTKTVLILEVTESACHHFMYLLHDQLRLTVGSCNRCMTHLDFTDNAGICVYMVLCICCVTKYVLLWLIARDA